MGLFDTIRRAVGGDDSSTDGDERPVVDDRPSDDGPELLDTATLDPATFRTYAEHVVDGADPLTFDPGALARLDTAIEESYGGETVGDAAGTTTYTGNTVRFGSYLGELLVRAYDGEWLQSDGRWGVTVAGPDDTVTVAVFDVAARSFGDEPVFAAVATRLEAELALDSTRETDADGQTESETAETDVDSAGSEPTRVEPEDKSHDTDPTPVVSRVTEEPQDGAPSGDDEADDSVSGVGGEAGPGATDSASDADGTEPSTAATADGEPAVGSNDAGPAVDAPADQSPDDTAGEQSTVETPAADPASDTPDDGLAADTPDVGTAAESAGEAVADETVTDTDEATTDTDEATTYIDEAEPAFDSATADPSDETTGAETPPGESAVDARGAGRPVDASAGTADSSTDEAATGTADEGTVEESTTPDSSPDASSDDAPDGEATPGPAGGESPADPDDGARIDDAPADGEEPGADVSDGSPGPAVPEGDTGASAAAGTEPSLDAAAVATPDGSEDGPSADGESAADSTGRPWEPGTVRADHADTAVEFAAFWGEHDLDFSPASLSRLDDLVDAEWDDDRFAETAFGSDASFDDRAFTSVVRELGGYFGEVLVRRLGGEWTDGTDHEAAVVVGGPSGQFAVPVFEVAITSLRKQAVFGRSYDALLEDLGRDGPAR
ncbi:hypothetical protein [Haloarcula sp. 1CSR25-25]|uniref:hypothetical protein n=1 Tax=Haloarcula sp. 1CSR25-25 TaxID=2862545 RepID=UPI00289448F2|nr:hypothetical protein [Haloarcula sp. 1CSR25-25]MDT3434072.1 hypothetical protein [Haloarcula sp. 1CSR25-25]